MTVLLIGYILLLIYLLSVLLLKRSLRGQVSHWFVANALAANLLFSVILRPGTIYDEFDHLQIAQTYCRVYNILHHVEQITVPAMLLMFTIDRMMYVRNPDAYGQRMSMPVVLVLLLMPWLLSVVVGLVSIYGFSDSMMYAKGESYKYENTTSLFCTHKDSHTFYTGMLIFEAIASLLVALASLIVTVLVVLFYLRYKRALAFSQAYSQLETEVTSYVRDATVIVCVLNLLFLLLFVNLFLLTEFGAISLDSHAIYFLFEFFEAMFILFLLPDVRHATCELCCKRKRNESEDQSEQTTLRYVANAEEAQ